MLYGDSYLPCGFDAVEAAFRRSTMPALMTVLRNEDRWDTSNAVYRDGMVLRYDKKRRSEEMRYIDYGLSAMQAEVLTRYEDGAVFEVADAFSALAGEGKLAGFEVTGRFYEIGSPAGIADTERYLSSHSLVEPLT